MNERLNRAVWLAPLLSLLLVGGIWVERRLFHLPAGDPETYHTLVRAVADRLPYRIGDWEGTKVDAPPAAVSMLKPNVLLGRKFQNPLTGEDATLMIVQCRDARDMGGHYPPICYPAHGWTAREATPRRLEVGGSVVPVTVYRFTKESLAQFSEVSIYNFFVRPDGSIESGGGGIREAAGDSRMKGFGAGQVQVLFKSSMTEARMDEVFGLLVASAFPILDAIREGNVQ